MTRITRAVAIEGHGLNALFDTGSVRNFVLREAAEKAPRIKVKPYTVGIGGKTMIVHEECIVRGQIEGLEFAMKAIPIDDIRTVDGREVGAIIRTTAMEDWEIRIDMAKA